MNIEIKTRQGKAIDLKVLQFSGGERHIQLSESLQSTGDEFSIRAKLRDSNDIMDLLLVKNALDHAIGSPAKVVLEIPYLPYARQDRVCAPGQAFSLEVMTALLKTINPVRLVIWDCHSQVGLDLTGAENISPSEIIRSSKALMDLLKADNSVLICPDKGAVGRCTAIKNSLGLAEMVRCEKRRDPATGKILMTEVLSDDLAGKTAVITDDICDGGYTFIKIAEQLREKNANKVVLFVTHGIFSKGLNVFDGLIDEIYTANSYIDEQNEKLHKIDFKLK